MQLLEVPPPHLFPSLRRGWTSSRQGLYSLSNHLLAVTSRSPWFAMAHKRKGQLTVTGEWARHLRPLWRRIFWKHERQAAKELEREERRAMGLERAGQATVEQLVAEIEALPPGSPSLQRLVPNQLTLRGEEVTKDIAMGGGS